MKKIILLTITYILSTQLFGQKLDSLILTDMTGAVKYRFKKIDDKFGLNNLPISDGIHFGKFYYGDSISYSRIVIKTKGENTVTKITKYDNNKVYSKKDFNKLSYYQKSVVKNWCLANDIVYPIWKDTTITDENKFEVAQYAIKKEMIDENNRKSAEYQADLNRITNANPGGNKDYYPYYYGSAYHPVILYYPSLGTYSIFR